MLQRIVYNGRVLVHCLELEPVLKCKPSSVPINIMADDLATAPQSLARQTFSCH